MNTFWTWHDGVKLIWQGCDGKFKIGHLKNTTQQTLYGPEIQTWLMTLKDQGKTLVGTSIIKWLQTLFGPALCRANKASCFLCSCHLFLWYSFRPARTQDWKHVVTIIAGLAARYSRPSHFILLQQEGVGASQDDEVKVYYVSTWLMQHIRSMVIHQCQMLVERG